MQSLVKLSIVLCSVISVAVMAATPNFYSGFRNLPASVSLYHYKVPDKILQAQLLAAMQKAMREGQSQVSQAMKKGGHGEVTSTATAFVLPQLYLFDTKGQEVFARTAESENLDSLLDRAFSSPAPLSNGKPLRTWFANLIPAEKRLVARPSITGKFTVLEYWAPWCEYCFVERDQLLAYFRKHPDLHVNWITADADVTKLTGSNSTPPLHLEGRGPG